MRLKPLSQNWKKPHYNTHFTTTLIVSLELYRTVCCIKVNIVMKTDYTLVWFSACEQYLPSKLSLLIVKSWKLQGYAWLLWQGAGIRHDRAAPAVTRGHDLSQTNPKDCYIYRNIRKEKVMSDNAHPILYRKIMARFFWREVHLFVRSSTEQIDLTFFSMLNSNEIH